MDSILKEVASLHGLSIDRFEDKLLTESFNLNIPLKPNSAPTSVRWVPGRLFSERQDAGEVRVMLVGDRPSYYDACYGYDRCLDVLKDRWDAIGIDYSRFYVTHFVKFFTPIKFSTLPKYHTGMCSGLFDMEYELRKPDYVIIMGSGACEELLGRKFNMSVGVDGLKYRDSLAFVIQHPYKITKTPYLIDPIISQLRHFNRAFRGIDVDTTARYTYIATLGDLAAAVTHMIDNGDRDIAVDFEWGGDNIRKGAKLRSLQISPREREAYFISFSKPGGDGPFGLQDVIPTEEGLQIVAKLLTRDDVAISGHHLRSELEWFLHYGMDVTEQCMRGVDTMYAYHELNADSDGVGLEKAAGRLTDMSRWEIPLNTWLKANDPKYDKEGRGYATVPEEILFPYGCADVDVIHRMKPILAKQLKRHKLKRPYTSVLFNKRVETLWDHYHCIAKLNIVSVLHMEQSGIHVNQDQIKTYTTFMDAQYSARLDELRGLMNYSALTLTRTQMLYLLYGMRIGKPGAKIPEDVYCFGATPVKTTEKPPRRWEDVPSHERNLVNPAVDEQTMKALRERYKTDGDTTKAEYLTKLIDTSAISTVISSFVPMPNKAGVYAGGILGSIDTNGRIYSTFLPTTKTARFRASKFNVLGMLNKKEFELAKMFSLKPLPVDADEWATEDLKEAGYLPMNYYPMRSCLSASPGNLWISADWKQAELFCAARISGDRNMIAILSDTKRDIHSEVAVRAFKLSCNPTEVKKRYTRYRIIAKAVIFGLLYGRGAKAIALELQSEGVDCSVAEAQALINAILEEFPGLKDYFDSTTEFMELNGYVETMWGRIRRFYNSDDRGVRAGNRREAINTRIQGTVSDSLEVAIYTAVVMLQSMNLKTRIIAPFHDAMEFDVPPGEVEVITNEVIPIAMTEVTKIPEWDLELRVDVEISEYWGGKARDTSRVEAVTVEV